MKGNLFKITFAQWPKLQAVCVFICFYQTVLWISKILARIRIRGSGPLTNGSGSGSCYLRHWRSSFSAHYFWKLNLHHFSKIKSHKTVGIKDPDPGGPKLYGSGSETLIPNCGHSLQDLTNNLVEKAPLITGSERPGDSRPRLVSEAAASLLFWRRRAVWEGIPQDTNFRPLRGSGRRRGLHRRYNS